MSLEWIYEDGCWDADGRECTYQIWVQQDGMFEVVSSTFVVAKNVVFPTLAEAKKLCEDSELPMPVEKLHAVVDSPLQGSKCGWASVLSGGFSGKTVRIMVEFSDGWCICDMGCALATIKIENMRPWSSVTSVNVKPA